VGRRHLAPAVLRSASLGRDAGGYIAGTVKITLGPARVADGWTCRPIPQDGWPDRSSDLVWLEVGHVVEGSVMRLELVLALPRQARSVVVARHLVRAAMVEMGVTDECGHDLEVAVSEACTNVLEQTGPSQELELRLQVLEDRCVLRVVDIGQQRRRLRLALPAYPLDDDVQPGRGLQLLRALADRVGFATLPERGAVVSLEKRLVYPQP
jgi:anti-sigma regulatory factor (Ser/Thr protein kinase)